jgi:hypothetical protein
MIGKSLTVTITVTILACTIAAYFVGGSLGIRDAYDDRLQQVRKQWEPIGMVAVGSAVPRLAWG